MSREKEMTGYPSIDKPWLKYYSEQAINASLPECTVYDNILRNNLEHQENAALEYFGNKITYSELFENVEKTQKAFEALEICKGDRVVMFTSATPETFYAILALSRIGAVANMLNPLFTKEQIKERINETEASLIIVLDQLYTKIDDVIEQTCIKNVVVVPVYNAMSGITKIVATMKKKKKIRYCDVLIGWNEFIKKGKKAEKSKDTLYEKDTPLVMVYSSGTTGASKGIVLTNDGINATIAHYLSPDFPYERKNTFLQVIPVWFSTGLVLSALMPLCLGVSVILEPVFSKENFARDIKKYRPNMTVGSTSMWLYAAQSQELQHMDLSFMTYPITGGEQMLPRVEASLNQFLLKHNCDAVLLKGYGMCELGSTASADSLIANKSGANGIPITHVTISVFDMETNEEKKYNERGEVRVKSPCRMKEYYKNPEATEKYFYKDADGNLWGATGDIGYMDEDGFLYVLGRANDTFVSKSGCNIYCFDIENVVLENDNIAQCEVVGISVEDYSVPVVHMVLEEDCKLTEIEIIEMVHRVCCDKLDADSIPYGYKICKAFPVKISGKRDMELIKQDKKDFVIPQNGELRKVTFD